ncbi:hypothetical protein U1Q18_002117 [Sarracenia purpurea var. burkii]
MLVDGCGLRRDGVGICGNFEMADVGAEHLSLDLNELAKIVVAEQIWMYLDGGVVENGGTWTVLWDLSLEILMELNWFVAEKVD